MPLTASAEHETKRLHGRFLTVGNPFVHDAFQSWWTSLPPDASFVEPFAGADGIPDLLREAGCVAEFSSYDLVPLADNVMRRDTLASFPPGFAAVVTNPPYLSRHFARRKGLDVDALPWGEYNNLYKVAVDLCLKHSAFVAAIIPESFVTSGLFTTRLRAVISLTTHMFDDTEMPTCLALWGPETDTDFEVWRGEEFVGRYSQLASSLPAPVSKERVVFNRVDGQLGLVAIDSSSGPTIRFCLASEIPAEKVKHSARLVTRIFVADLSPQDVGPLIDAANCALEEYRTATQDVLLTAFKGLRKDGYFRRRLDYDTARRLLATALN
jgi:hypothetical protein